MDIAEFNKRLAACGGDLEALQDELDQEEQDRLADENDCEHQMSRAEYKDYWREECATTGRGD